MNLEVDNSEWDVHLKRTLEKWMAPGLAVTVLKDKELVYSRGSGYRDIDNKLEMTRDTIHPIASCTKSFTSTALAMLVDEGKLEWNTSIHEIIPQFRLKDSVASRHVTIAVVVT
ncbi:MAG: class A beta-lactamase-related serine hydrolase [Candidatus Thorarchaeota archaeon]|nr:MAG: class A beta-lactamase-related serine hydrolase [Candidatus Thorarchaeota archaeon]